MNGQSAVCEFFGFACRQRKADRMLAAMKIRKNVGPRHTIGGMAKVRHAKERCSHDPTGTNCLMTPDGCEPLENV